VTRRTLAVLAVAIGSIAGPLPAHAQTTAQKRATRAVETIEASPGTVVRWSVPGTKRCGMGARSWTALQETCYYPIDLATKPGVVRVSRHGAGAPAFARIAVLPATPEREDITLGDIPQANPSAADVTRNAREQGRIARVWKRREQPAQFTLPLGQAARALLAGKGFGALWAFNSPP